MAAVSCEEAACLSKHSLDTVDPLAVCTDGSPATYYFQRSTATENDMTSALDPRSTWIFHLQGGGWCYDEASCALRCGTLDNTSTEILCSSKLHGDIKQLTGIFWDTAPALRKANKVYIEYCTSDSHMGNASAMGRQFRGKVVIQAALQDLVARHGLGSGAKKDFVIFGGSSAGARGAMVHLDYVPDMLGSAASNVDVVGFLDSPAWIDMEMKPLDPAFPGFQYITKRIQSFAIVEHLGIDCERRYDGELWKCIFGQYRLPTITTPYFLVASQYDQYQLGKQLRNGMNFTRPANSEETVFVELFAKRTRDFVEALKKTRPENAVFSWACMNHAVSLKYNGLQKLFCDPAETTMSTALHQFLGLSKPTTQPPLEWMDTCTTFGCGRGCFNNTILDEMEAKFDTQAIDTGVTMIRAIGAAVLLVMVFILVFGCLASRRRQKFPGERKKLSNPGMEMAPEMDMNAMLTSAT